MCATLVIGLLSPHPSEGEPGYEKPLGSLAIVSCQQLIVSVEQVIHTDSDDVAAKIGRMMEGVSANTRANGA
jgi:hypothetical protein